MLYWIQQRNMKNVQITKITENKIKPRIKRRKTGGNGMGAIQLKNVTKKFGDQMVIDDLNLSIEDGSFTVLVGPSGCGKSTTLRMITGLDEPTSGDIYIDGKKINDLTPGKRDIAMVFQNYALYPTMTVRENIEFGLENKKVPKEESGKKAMDMILDIAKIIEVGGIYDGKVTKIMPFGAFINIGGGNEGLLHISKISSKRVEKVEDVLSVGDEVTVKVSEIDNQGRINLNMKDLEASSNNEEHKENE